MSASEELINTSELARKFNLSRPTVISRLQEAGIEPVEETARGGKKYRLGDVAHLMRSEYSGKTDKKTKAQERKLEAEAREKEIKVERLEGTLVPIADVERALVDIFRSLYQLTVVQFTATHAADIARLRTRGEVEAYLKEQLGKIYQSVRTNPNNLLTRDLADDE